MSCEGPLGKTSLFNVEELTAAGPDAFMRSDIDLSKVQVEPADVKKHMGY